MAYRDDNPHSPQAKRARLARALHAHLPEGTTLPPKTLAECIRRVCNVGTERSVHEYLAQMEADGLVVKVKAGAKTRSRTIGFRLAA